MSTPDDCKYATRVCSHWLRGSSCPNPECLFRKIRIGMKMFYGLCETESYTPSSQENRLSSSQEILANNTRALLANKPEYAIHFCNRCARGTPHSPEDKYLHFQFSLTRDALLVGYYKFVTANSYLGHTRIHPFILKHPQVAQNQMIMDYFKTRGPVKRTYDRVDDWPAGQSGDRQTDRIRKHLSYDDAPLPTSKRYTHSSPRRPEYLPLEPVAPTGPYAGRSEPEYIPLSTVESGASAAFTAPMDPPPPMGPTSSVGPTSVQIYYHPEASDTRVLELEQEVRYLRNELMYIRDALEEERYHHGQTQETCQHLHESYLQSRDDFIQVLYHRDELRTSLEQARRAYNAVCPYPVPLYPVHSSQVPANFESDDSPG